jgi:hypothetical protein
VVGVSALIASVLVGPSVAAAQAPSQLAAAATSGKLSVANLDFAGGSSRVMLNRIQTPGDGSQRFHDKNSLKLTNSGPGTLTITSATVQWGPFSVSASKPLPVALAVGSYVDVTVVFNAQSGKWYSGNLAVNSTSSTGASTNIALIGYWQQYSENNLEPWLPDLVRNYGYKTVMPTSMWSRGAYFQYSSDEVLSPYWRLLDPSKTAKMTDLAAWHGYPGWSYFKTFPKGAPTSTASVFTSLDVDAQSFLPRSSSWGKGSATFQPSGTFGFKLNLEFSDPKLNNSTPDRAAGCTATQCGQHVRVFAVRGADGVLVPGNYILVEDTGGINYDYQDNVYLVENITPAA